nr:hypothetical protein [Patescibacteria group bacterium]
MRKLYFIILFVLCTLGIVWAGSTTTNFSLYKPAIDETGWGASVNTNFDTVDSEMKTNRDHLSADGSSHTFIDQSVVSGATPTFTGTNFTGVPTSGITGGNWKVNYINGSGALTEVALGDSGDVLVSQGTSAAPVMQAQSGSGSGGGSVEGTAILSTGEGGATKFLREDGDGTSSWQIATASHAGTITWSGTSILETGTAFQFGDGTDATVTHTYANTGTNVTIAYSNAAMAVTAALTATNLSGTNTGDVTHALDLVTTAPITGGQDNVFVGADGDVTVAITVLKDL